MNRRSWFVATVLAWWGAIAAVAAGRPPNMLVVVADDLGFSDLGCYGGEIQTPRLDALASHGLRYTQFYNTGRCWPTRSALLTGYYAQQVRMDPPAGRLPAWARLLPHDLAPLGYRCYQSGKWHVSGAPQAVADGGFDHAYVLGDQNRYFSPKSLTEDDLRLPPVRAEEGYYATTAIADHAVRCLAEHARAFPDRPFFSYVAFTAPHFPLHALPTDIERCHDRYDEGWDVVRARRWKRLRDMGLVQCELSPREEAFMPRYFKPTVLDLLGPGETPHPLAWTELTTAQQRFQAMKMSLHAAMVERLDRELGRVLDQILAMGQWDDTIVCFLSDNGADATLMIRADGHDREAVPGTAASYLCLGPGWASACNAPFRRHKIWVHEGGISTPLIVHWPRGIAARGELRRTPGHVIDLAPTLRELAGDRSFAEHREDQAPLLPGRSLSATFLRDVSVEREPLFFHHEGNRALRDGNWKLVSAREDGDVWELYDLSVDRGEQTNLAAQDPDRVARMAATWQRMEDTFRADAGPATTTADGKSE